MKISQREARRLRKQVAILEADAERLRNAWLNSESFANLTFLCSIGLSSAEHASIKVASRLGYPVILKPDITTTDGRIRVYAYGKRSGS